MNRTDPKIQSRLDRFHHENRIASRHNTDAVQKIAKQLTDAGIPFKREKVFYAGHRHGFLVDFYLPRPYKLCVEVDGGYHERHKSYDADRDEYLTRQRHLRVARFTNAEVLADGFSILPRLRQNAPRKTASLKAC